MITNLAGQSSYTVELPLYEGPLDLLLELIERAELDITKISLAAVADQYLDYLQSVSGNLDDLSFFLVVAARLLQIKSEALLPRPPEREPGEEDPGDELARQLVAYKKYKQIAILLSQREKAGLRTFLRSAPSPKMDTRLELADLDVEDLRAMMASVLAREPRGEPVDTVVRPPLVRIRDRILRIVRSLNRLATVTFQDVMGDGHSRIEIVVSFLAMLELIKQGQVTAEQSELFGSIQLERGPKWDADQALSFELEFDE